MESIGKAPPPYISNRYKLQTNSVGTPDPPSDLVYNDGVVIESSVDLQWTRPAHTGGVSLTGYNVSANGWSEEATDDGVRVSYTANSSFVYGEVFVTAVNYCGQESQPTAINIAAAGDYAATQVYYMYALCLVRRVALLREGKYTQPLHPLYKWKNHFNGDIGMAQNMKTFV